MQKDKTKCVWIQTIILFLLFVIVVLLGCDFIVHRAHNNLLQATYAERIDENFEENKRFHNYTTGRLQIIKSKSSLRTQ